MKKTGKAITYLLIFYVVGIALNTFNLIDYNAPMMLDIAKVIGICFLISLFLRLLRVDRDSAFVTGIVLAYASSLVVMYLDAKSLMVLINLIIAIVLSIIFTKNLS